MSTKHTKGRWETDGLNVVCGSIIVATTDVNNSPELDESVCEANARLIAAAPKLLETLKHINNYFNVENRPWAGLDALIRKTEGQ
jgi:hypothetical protein